MSAQKFTEPVGIELYTKINDPITAATKIGEWLAKSGMFGCKSVEQGQVLALACMAEQKNPIQILREYHMIDGKLSMRADAMLAGLRQRGGSYKVLNRTADKAAIEVEVDGNKQAFSFTWDDAKHEPFVFQKDGKSLKTNWATPRARMQMLWARVVSDAVRTMMPEVVAGTYTPEEIQDFPDARKAVTVEASIEAEPPETLEPEVVKDGDHKADTARKVEPEPTTANDDPTLMPVGPKAGKPFADFTLKQLQTIFKRGKSMKEFTSAHLEEVSKCITAKETEDVNND